MLVSEFDYKLPPALIAQQPAARRSESRLLRLLPGGALEDLTFADFPALLGPGDLVVLNDTRVIRARLVGHKASGGSVEVLVERIVAPNEALALVRASHPPRTDSEIFLAGDARATVLGREGDLYRLRFACDIEPLLECHGALPLPPYIAHAPGAEDEERYQTVYARAPGAVAAPTAGLHFDAQTLRAIEARGARLAHVTLHVGAGTFQPVRVEEVEAHRMHKERYLVPAETRAAAQGRRVLSVGTTSLRALESAALSGRSEGETDLFIYPGFRFRAVQRLLTNFHLPKSTLLMLACAFGGKEKVLAAYRHAVERRYRFFSYGDAMLIET